MTQVQDVVYLGIHQTVTVNKEARQLYIYPATLTDNLNSDFALYCPQINTHWLHAEECCLYSLELPRQGDSNEYRQHMFLWSNSEKLSLNYPQIPFLSVLLSQPCCSWYLSRYDCKQ